ncbi:MAG TPA: hypothetical protein VH814_24200 [Steroidobacteraceae bacterium]|jgi:hypothetical protein
MAALLTSTSVAADVLSFVCVGTEKFYAKTLEGGDPELPERPTTIQLEFDRQKQTITLHGTTQADGTGPARPAYGTFNTSYQKTNVFFGVTFKYVLISVPKTTNQLVVIASTHPSLDPDEAEGRAVFVGNCRLPMKKN